MSAIHCSMRPSRALSELTFHVANRVMQLLAACFFERPDVERLPAAAGCTSSAGAAADFFGARLVAAAFFVAGALTLGSATFFAGAAFFVCRRRLLARRRRLRRCLLGGDLLRRSRRGGRFSRRPRRQQPSCGGEVRPAGSPGSAPVPGRARSMLRRDGAKLSTTRVTASPCFITSRALRGGGLPISRSGT